MISCYFIFDINNKTKIKKKLCTRVEFCKDALMTPNYLRDQTKQQPIHMMGLFFFIYIF